MKSLGTGLGSVIYFRGDVVKKPIEFNIHDFASPFFCYYFNSYKTNNRLVPIMLTLAFNDISLIYSAVYKY